MPQIKHIAIATNDAEKTAKFYSEVFGLRQVAALESSGKRERQGLHAQRRQRQHGNP